MTLTAWLPALLALEGNPRGPLAILLVLVWVGVLFGLPYMLLVSVYGAKQGYLVIGLATSIVVALVSAIWLFGAPGTPPATGPRGREPGWVAFLATSQQARDFPAVKTYPNGWDKPGTKYAGNVDSNGELKNLQDTWQTALAARAASQGLPATDAADWSYRLVAAATADEAKIPQARVFFVNSGHKLVAGIDIPATDKHAETLVFAYHDTGQVFYWSAIFLGASLVSIFLHIGALAWMERRRMLPASTPA